LTVFLKQIECFFHSLERDYFAQSWCSSSMKTLRGRQCSFNQLTQFIMLYKLLDPFAASVNDFLTRATVLLPFTWKGWFWTKVMFLTLKPWEISNIPFKQ
jgi:hypothetical protein